jgi:hypothetical protein
MGTTLPATEDRQKSSIKAGWVQLWPEAWSFLQELTPARELPSPTVESPQHLCQKDQTLGNMEPIVVA